MVGPYSKMKKKYGKPDGKRPRDRKRLWIDGVAADMRAMGIENQNAFVHNRNKWYSIVVTVNALRK